MSKQFVSVILNGVTFRAGGEYSEGVFRMESLQISERGELSWNLKAFFEGVCWVADPTKFPVAHEIEVRAARMIEEAEAVDGCF